MIESYLKTPYIYDSRVVATCLSCDSWLCPTRPFFYSFSRSFECLSYIFMRFFSSFLVLVSFVDYCLFTSTSLATEVSGLNWLSVIDVFRCEVMHEVILDMDPWAISSSFFSFWSFYSFFFLFFSFFSSLWDMSSFNSARGAFLHISNLFIGARLENCFSCSIWAICDFSSYGSFVEPLWVWFNSNVSPLMCSLSMAWFLLPDFSSCYRKLLVMSCCYTSSELSLTDSLLDIPLYAEVKWLFWKPCLSPCCSFPLLYAPALLVGDLKARLPSSIIWVSSAAFIFNSATLLFS